MFSCELNPCGKPAYARYQWGFECPRSGRRNYCNAILCKEHAEELWEKINPNLIVGGAWYAILDLDDPSPRFNDSAIGNTDGFWWKRQDTEKTEEPESYSWCTQGVYGYMSAFQAEVDGFESRWVLMPEIGERYERYVVEGSAWRHEIRRILDVSPFGVLYLREETPTEGTHVGFDNYEPPQLLTAKEWDEWAALARKLDAERQSDETVEAK